MRFGILGPLAVWTADGTPVKVAEQKVRGLLAHLLAHRGRPVATEALLDAVWGDDLPAHPHAVLRSKISLLRRLLEEAEPGGRQLIVSRRPGYLIQPAPGTLDADEFQALCTRAHECDRAADQVSLLTDALARWRGEVLEDLADRRAVRPMATTLEEQRLGARELLVEARLALGGDATLVGDLTELVERHPWRERIRAAHMRALYRAGRQSEALDSYHRLRESLRDQFGIDPAPGVHQLYLRMLRQAPELDPAEPPAAASNLPSALTELVGRDDLVADTRARLREGRLVTLTGPGGVGKTRLALACADGGTDAHPDGVWFVELASIDRSPSDDGTVAKVVDAITTVLGLADDSAGQHPGAQPPASPLTRLTKLLRDRRMLLVIDNCEHVAAAAATVVEGILRHASAVRILATSREPLGITGEVLQAVPPLQVPERLATDRGPAALRSYSAVALFAARAEATAPGFVLDEANADDVLTICRRLDGIPLALELAATRVRVLGVAALAAGLDDRFALLTGDRRAAPARQQTLQAMIDWSWELLTEPERAVLRRLAVHPHGCSLAAAEHICADPPVSGSEVLDLLSCLVRRCLVVMQPGPDGPRYRLLESVAAYGLARLREAGEEEAVRHRHAAYYLDLATQADHQLRGPAQRYWLRRLDTETANLGSALDHALACGDTPLALRLAGALAWYWVLRGRLTEAERTFTAGLRLPRPAPEELTTVAATWKCAFGALAGKQPDLRRELGNQLVEPSPDLADPYALGRAQGLLAVVTRPDPERFGGLDLVEWSLATSRRLGYAWGEAAALSTRAWEALSRSDFDGLVRDAQQSAALFRELGDEWGVLHATDPLAALAVINGDWEDARRLHLDGLRIAHELGLWPKVSYKLCELGRIALLTRDYSAADEFHRRAARLAREQSYPVVAQFADLGLAVSARRQARLDEAERLLRPWQEWNERTQWDDGLAHVLAELGFVAEQRADVDRALALHTRGYRVARGTGEPRAVSRALVGLAAAVTLTDRCRAAARLLGAAAGVRSAAGLLAADVEQLDLDRVTDALRCRLGDEDYARRFDDGTRSGLDDCVHDALGPPAVAELRATAISRI